MASYDGGCGGGTVFDFLKPKFFERRLLMAFDAIEQFTEEGDVPRLHAAIKDALDEIKLRGGELYEADTFLFIAKRLLRLNLAGEAESYIQKALRLEEQWRPGQEAHFNVLTVLAESYEVRGDREAALATYEKAFDSAHPSPMMLGHARVNYGHLVRDAGDLQGGMSLFDSAAAAFEIAGAHVEIVVLALRCGRWLLDELGDRVAARRWANRAATAAARCPTLSAQGRAGVDALLTDTAH